MELGTPNKWQKEMISHGFDPLDQDEPVQSLVEFCERIETIEGMEAERSPNHQSNKNSDKKVTKSILTSNNRTKRYAEGNTGYDPNKICSLHGPGHSNNECKVLKSIGADMKAQKEQGRGSSTDYKKRRDYSFAAKKTTEKQLKALIQEQMLAAFQSATKSANTKKRKVTLATLQKKDPPVDESDDSDDDDNSNTCAAFQQKLENLSVDDDDLDLDLDLDFSE